ncbi:MAG: hypothetical protein JNK11_02825 [Alphaproteobacteria bacterium]|nr:hypothetical protein [Alphaproteobacteria bacterium]
MAIVDAFAILNDMVADRVVDLYAIAGAVAAANYVEAAATEDIDVLIEFAASPGRLVSLAPVLDWLRRRGYAEHRKEGVVIEGWPVQFLPVADALDREALAEAASAEVARAGKPAVTVRVLRPEHIVAICLRVGRTKDHLRVVQFLEEGRVDLASFADVLRRHGLHQRWQAFCRQAGRDPSLPPAGAAP